eukprot:2205938-Prymnesium_polylepis.1
MAPIEPSKSTIGPPLLIFAPSFVRPVAPSTCRIVLHASIGIRNTRNIAAAAEAETVLAATGRLLVNCARGGQPTRDRARGAVTS